MTNNKVTLHEVFEVTNRIEDKLDKLSSRVSVLEIWRAEIITKISFISVIVTLAFSLSWDYLKTRILNK